MKELHSLGQSIDVVTIMDAFDILLFTRSNVGLFDPKWVRHVNPYILHKGVESLVNEFPELTVLKSQYIF